MSAIQIDGPTVAPRNDSPKGTKNSTDAGTLRLQKEINELNRQNEGLREVQDSKRAIVSKGGGVESRQYQYQRFPSAAKQPSPRNRVTSNNASATDSLLPSSFLHHRLHQSHLPLAFGCLSWYGSTGRTPIQEYGNTALQTWPIQAQGSFVSLVSFCASSDWRRARLAGLESAAPCSAGKAGSTDAPGPPRQVSEAQAMPKRTSF